jgi:hypothetical protein
MGGRLVGKWTWWGGGCDERRAFKEVDVVGKRVFFMRRGLDGWRVCREVDVVGRRV